MGRVGGLKHFRRRKPEIERRRSYNLNRYSRKMSTKMSRFRWILRNFTVHPCSRESLTGNLFQCFKRKRLLSNSLSTTASRQVSTTPVPEFENESLQTHEDLYELSLSKPDKFWGTLARSRLDWFSDFGMVRDCDLGKGHIRWFLDGKINASGKLVLLPVPYLSYM